LDSRWQDGHRDFAALVKLYLDAGGVDMNHQIDEQSAQAILDNADLHATAICGATQMAGFLSKLHKQGIISEPAQLLADYVRMISSDTDEPSQ
jgi:hypothetical protein